MTMHAEGDEPASSTTGAVGSGARGGGDQNTAAVVGVWGEHWLSWQPRVFDIGHGVIRDHLHEPRVRCVFGRTTVW